MKDMYEFAITVEGFNQSNVVRFLCFKKSLSLLPEGKLDGRRQRVNESGELSEKMT